MLESWTNVVASAGMFRPAFSFISSVMDGHLAALWDKGRGVVVEVTIDHDTGRQLWLYSCGPKQIERDISLRDEEIPAIGGEMWVGAAEDCNEAVLERLYSPFSGIGLMIAGRRELVWQIDGFQRCVLNSL